MAKQLITLTVNGDEHELAVAPCQTLLEVLRDDLGLTGTKRGCTAGSCGVCRVTSQPRAWRVMLMTRATRLPRGTQIILSIWLSLRRP